MKGFFEVISRKRFHEILAGFPQLGAETVHLSATLGRVTAADITAPEDLPAFNRSRMDGYAVRAADTFGASDSQPAYLNMAGSIAVDSPPAEALKPLECAEIVTGGCLPVNSDAVVMVEYTREIGNGIIEVCRALAPGDNMTLRGEDVKQGCVAISGGRRIRPQEIGLLAALGLTRVDVGIAPRVGIISTGDEVVPVDAKPKPGQVRDVNSHTMLQMVGEAGGIAAFYGIVPDDLDRLKRTLRTAVEENDVVLISGGSSVGARDMTVTALESLANSRILAHGVAISPGKPTILARVGDRTVFGVPGHVASAQVVCHVLILPFLRHLVGEGNPFDLGERAMTARLSANTASKRGREDYVRVRIERKGSDLPVAVPVMGLSGLLRSLVAADGLIRISENTEGLEAGCLVEVFPF